MDVMFFVAIIVSFVAGVFLGRWQLSHKNETIVGATDISNLRDAASRAQALADERQNMLDKFEKDFSDLRADLKAITEKYTMQKAETAKLEEKIDAEHRAANEKITFLQKFRAEMEMKFKDLASDALKTQGEAFSKTNLEKIEATLAPLREHVGHFEKELKGVNETALKDRASLKTVIEELTKRSQLLSEETVALTRALKADKRQQGAWGEMILENILESSGLRKDHEYEIQAHRIGAEGKRLRPDAVVFLPGNKSLVIDSKVSLIAYQEAVNASDDKKARDEARMRHAAALKSHIDDLAVRDYQHAEIKSVDYVIMFVPIEGSLPEALQANNNLTEYALEKGVMIATPTTLMMALKTVAHVWAVERRNQNADAIAKLAGQLYDKFVRFSENMQDVGKTLDKACDAHQKAFSQLSEGRGNMVSQIERLKELGAKTSKNLPFSDGNETLLK